VRLRRRLGAGRPATTASVTLFTGVAAGRPAPTRASRAAGLPMPLRGGAAEAELPPAGTVTMVLTPGRTVRTRRASPRRAQPPPRPAPRARARARPAGLHPLLAAREGAGPRRGTCRSPCTSPPGRIAPPPRPAETPRTRRPRLRPDRGLRHRPRPAGTVQLAADGGDRPGAGPGHCAMTWGRARPRPLGPRGSGAAGGAGAGRHFRGGPDCPTALASSSRTLRS